MQRKHIYAWVLILFSVFISCQDVNLSNNLSKVLDKAGDNKKELLNVIKHYSKVPADSLKLKAALFLIENMEGMPTLDTNSVGINKQYFDFISTIDRSKLVFPVLTRGVDSIIAKLGGVPQPPKAVYLDELQTVSSEFLIKNIDSAFYVWQNMPWARSASFEDFCEYILPYRCTDTYSSNIREFFLERFRKLPDSISTSENMFKVGEFIINDLKPWFKEDPNIIQKYPFLAPMKFADLLKGRVGACDDANSVRVAALRAMGIRAAFDEIPNWGNCNLPHYWYKIIDAVHDTIKSKITNENKDRYTQHIISATSYDEPFFGNIPPGIQIAYNRTVPKVYRQCFSKQKNSLALLADAEEIPSYFRNPRLKDVTSNYVETASIKLSVGSDVGAHRFIYLCVFDNRQWLPVAWSRVENGKAEFKDMGKNIIYLPAYYEDGNIIHAASPFLLTLKGDIQSIQHTPETETVKLWTKFPVRPYVMRWESYMIGGRFQLANKTDFSDSVTVYKIQKLPFYETEFDVKENKPFRFLLYQFKGQNYLEASELEFYGRDEKGELIKLSGKSIGNPGYYPYMASKLFDGIPYNFYRADTSLPDRYVGIDLGSKATQIAKIKFMPYTDDNAVRNGDTYELFYWEGEWKSVGMSTATGKYVLFNKVPKNALLLLINTSGGVQQRIFTYENGKQDFW